MEGNTTNKIKGIKSENKEDFLESKPPEEKQYNVKSENFELEIKESKPNLNIFKNKTDAGEGSLKNNNKVLKRKVTEDGVMIERVLSEGEASSGFETVSSFDSKADFDDLDLNSLTDGDDFNVLVKIENELAFQNPKDSTGRVCYKKGRSNSPVAYKNRSDRFLYENKNRRSDRREHKYKDDNNSEKYYTSDRTDKISREREEFSRSRRSSCANRTKRSPGRRNNRESRSRRSRSCERIRSRKSRSTERNRRRSSSYEDRKTEVRRSGSFDRNSAKSYIKSSPSRKRKQSSPYKSSSSVWKRLDKRLSPSQGKKSKINNRSSRSSFSNSDRRKERTPFLVELERKLKEAERLKNIKGETTDGSLVQIKASGNVNVTVPMSEGSTAINQNSNPLQRTTFIPSAPNIQGVVYPFQYVAMPTLSTDNLPLVPGPTGLPVHITMTGEQIPHDMDGRRIPIGPNGYYLPVDPTGRLFPHIVSPANQAIPIHMTEDGILRLPNSEPVPYGPGHQLPVNIDGSVILISSDRKPLYPCPNLPKEPPLPLVQMMDSFNVGWITPQQEVPGNSQSVQTVFQQNLEITAQQAPSTNEVYFQQSKVDFNVLDFIQNPSEEFNKADLVRNYKEKARERNEDVLKYIEIQKNLGVNPSRGGVKRSIPIKLLHRKTIKDDNCSSGSDMVLDSGDSDSTSGQKSAIGPVKGLAEEILSSDDEQGILKSICDIEVNKVQNTGSQQDDPIMRKILLAIKSLKEKNYKPPILGRLIIPNIILNPVIKKPYESPLLRNRQKLPFITPDVQDDFPTSTATKKDAITFRFLPQKKSETGERPGFKCSKINNRNFNKSKFPVFTFDFAMQCDFTSAIIKQLSSKISVLEMELVRLRNVNANLFDHYRTAQVLNEKKNDELVKAMREIQERDNEIQCLKSSVEKQQ